MNEMQLVVGSGPMAEIQVGKNLCGGGSTILKNNI
jgi:hypothetical protein